MTRTAEWRCSKSIPIGKRPEGAYQVTLRLSDCFEAVEELTGRAFSAPELELVVKV